MSGILEKSNMAAESVNLFLAHEEEIFRQIDEENAKIDNYIEEMELLNRLLAVIERDKTEEGIKIEGEDRKLIDELAEREGLQHIFAPKEYDWNKEDFDEMTNRIEKLEERYSYGKDKLDNLKRQLTQHLEGPLQRQITQASEKMVLKENKLNEALSLFKAGLNKINDVNTGILRNMMSGG